MVPNYVNKTIWVVQATQKYSILRSKTLISHPCEGFKKNHKKEISKIDWAKNLGYQNWT